MTAAEKIDQILKGKGLSRRQLALKADIPPSTLQSALERNKEIPLSMLANISGALGIDLYNLISDDDLKHFDTETLINGRTRIRKANENKALETFLHSLTGVSFSSVKSDYVPLPGATPEFMKEAFRHGLCKNYEYTEDEGITTVFKRCDYVEMIRNGEMVGRCSVEDQKRLLEDIKAFATAWVDRMIEKGKIDNG